MRLCSPAVAAAALQAVSNALTQPAQPVYLATHTYLPVRRAPQTPAQ